MMTSTMEQTGSATTVITGSDGLSRMQLAGAIDAAADRDLERRVVSYLARRHVPGLRQLQVTAHNGTVTLRGQVRSFYEKQLSHHCCRRVAGVVGLVDAIDVVTPPRTSPAVA